MLYLYRNIYIKDDRFNSEKEMIKQIFFNHSGGLYRYKIHNIKANKLVNFKKLKEYLNEMLINCPNSYFMSGPRSSGLRFNVNADVKKVNGHEISLLAKYGLETSMVGTAHEKVQSFMLERDNQTIAVEVPIWLMNNELHDYKRMFKSEQPLTGHIDVLRIEDDKIWIWDYKPNAYLEKYATTQIFFYALMLSKRTNIDLGNFRCGYFDKNYAYMFKPSIDCLDNVSNQKVLSV